MRLPSEGRKMTWTRLPKTMPHLAEPGAGRLARQGQGHPALHGCQGHTLPSGTPWRWGPERGELAKHPPGPHKRHTEWSQPGLTWGHPEPLQITNSRKWPQCHKHTQGHALSEGGQAHLLGSGGLWVPSQDC